MDQAPLLLIIEDGAVAERAQATAKAVLCPDGQAFRQPIAVARARELKGDAKRLRLAAAAWVMCDIADQDWVWDVTADLTEAQVPALITQPGVPSLTSEEDGVVLCDASADPALIAAVIKTLLIQSPVVRAMHAEIKLLRAQQGGLADQIGRIDEELRLAAQLQREFLPTEMPSVDGIGFEVFWRPAGYVSGDIYDVTRLDEEHIGFFLADAVGHGVPAALMTVFIKQSLNFKRIDREAKCGYRIVPPGEALASLNRDMVLQQNGKVRFATACCGIINTQTRQATIARAGHPYPMLLHADGSHEMIEADGGLLGVFEEEVFEQVTLDLRDGDRFLLYSDGFEMAFPDDGPKAGVANTRYTQEFLDLAHGSAESALDRLRHKLDRQAGSLNQRDDLSVVCLWVDKHASALTGECAEAAA